MWVRWPSTLGSSSTWRTHPGYQRRWPGTSSSFNWRWTCSKEDSTATLTSLLSSSLMPCNVSCWSIIWWINCLLAYLIGWLLIDWLIGWLIDWLVTDYWLIDWLIDWLIACLLACLLTCLMDWLIAWWMDWLIDWLLDGWMDWAKINNMLVSGNMTPQKMGRKVGKKFYFKKKFCPIFYFMTHLFPTAQLKNRDCVEAQGHKKI